MNCNNKLHIKYKRYIIEKKKLDKDELRTWDKVEEEFSFEPQKRVKDRNSY